MAMTPDYRSQLRVKSPKTRAPIGLLKQKPEPLACSSDAAVVEIVESQAATQVEDESRLGSYEEAYIRAHSDTPIIRTSPRVPFKPRQIFFDSLRSRLRNRLGARGQVVVGLPSGGSGA